MNSEFNIMEQKINNYYLDFIFNKIEDCLNIRIEDNKQLLEYSNIPNKIVIIDYIKIENIKIIERKTEYNELIKILNNLGYKTVSTSPLKYSTIILDLSNNNYYGFLPSLNEDDRKEIVNILTIDCRYFIYYYNSLSKK